MIIFMAVLPHILNALGLVSGLPSRSEIAKFSFKKFFLFQFINLFLVAAVSSTVFKEIQNIIQNPGQIPVLLARGIPQSSILFINYIMMRSLFTNFFKLVDIVDILLNYVFFQLSKTPKQSLSALAPSPQHNSQTIPEALLILSM